MNPQDAERQDDDTPASLSHSSSGFAQPQPPPPPPPKITLDQIASMLLKQNFILTALELHTELAEQGRGELPRLRDYFSNPANFEQQVAAQTATTTSSSLLSASNSHNTGGFYPLHRAPSVQTFDSLDLTRYSDDVDVNHAQEDKIAVLEFELRKARETIKSLRNTLTFATETTQVCTRDVSLL